MKTKIILPFYNVEKWIKTTFNSIISQTYKNFEVYFLDDCSTDNSFKILSKLTANLDNINIISNKTRIGSVANLWKNMPLISQDLNDVIIIIDGDDWFFDSHVVKKVVDKHLEGWEFTHSKFVEYPNMLVVDEGGYSIEVKEKCSFRQDNWRCSGLRTFRRRLWNNIELKDIQNSEEEFYMYAGDQAYTYPLLEAAGDKIYRFNEIFHVYNRQNPINDDKVSRESQIRDEIKIRKINIKKYNFIIKNNNIKFEKLL